MISDKRESGATIAFRSDASTQLGSGHVMRCLTLANELARRGADIRFLCRDDAGNLISRVESSGIPVQSMPAREIHDPADDAVRTLDLIRDARVEWMVVDHYHLGLEWERQIRPHVGHILVIEDLLDRAHDCDVLLDQNWRGAASGEELDKRMKSTQQRALLGPRYALLQPQYAAGRNSLTPRGGTLKRVMIFFGGSDPSNETGKAVDALSRPEFSHLSVDVVIGGSYSQRDSLLRKIQHRPQTTLHEKLPSLAPLMAQADLAIGAGGSTSWERVCLNLYTLVTTLAPNQEPGSKALHETGYIDWIGRIGEVSIEDYREALSRELTDLERLPPLVDGYGTKRVAELLIPTGRSDLVLRPAQVRDAGLFFDWRNEPLARSMSFTSTPVTWEAHLKWFERKCRDQNSSLYVAEADGLPVGQARIDFWDEVGLLSYSVDALARGRGWGGWLVREALRRTPRANVVRIEAHVKPENTASRRIFKRLGWAESVGDEGEIRYSLARGAQHLSEMR